jgi:hypothetical protein
MKTTNKNSPAAPLIVVPPPPTTTTNTWVQSTSPTASNPRSTGSKAKRELVRQETTRKVASRQSMRPAERRGQPRSHRAGRP